MFPRVERRDLLTGGRLHAALITLSERFLLHRELLVDWENEDRAVTLAPVDREKTAPWPGRMCDARRVARSSP